MKNLKNNIMKIKKINSQNRRDFHADYECEHCGHIEKDQYGYDDDNFHRNIIPDMECKKCGEKAGDGYRPMGTKYAENQII